MNGLPLAALLSILQTDPPTLVNHSLSSSARAITLTLPNGQERVMSRLGPGRSARLEEAETVEAYELSGCSTEDRALIQDALDFLAERACLRALARIEEVELSAVLPEGRQSREPQDESALAAVLFRTARPRRQLVVEGAATQTASNRPAPQQEWLLEQAAEVLPELVALEIHGGELGAVARETLNALGWTDPIEQLRRVTPLRRPELLSVLGRHPDGRAFGLLVRASLESHNAAEREAAGRALADYPEDAVRRLSRALDDEQAVRRDRAALALKFLDTRSLRSLTPLLSGDAPAPLDVARAVELLIEQRKTARETRIRTLIEETNRAVLEGNAIEASAKVTALRTVDQREFARQTALRVEVLVLSATSALDRQPRSEANDKAAAELLLDARALGAKSGTYKRALLRVARAFVARGYPTSAARILAPEVGTGGAIRREFERALHDEIRRLMEANDRAAAAHRLAELRLQGADRLAARLERAWGVRNNASWWTFPGITALAFCGIGLAIGRERRRRRREFTLIESEQDRAKYRVGPYR